MIFLRNYFINTTSGLDVLSIVHEVGRAIRESSVSEGLVTVSVPAPGGALAILEPLPDVIAKFKEAIGLFPGENEQTKNKRKEDVLVGPRVVAAILGKSLSIPFKDGRLLIAPREEPVLIDLERKGLRREFYVQIVGADAKPQGRVPPQMARR